MKREVIEIAQCRPKWKKTYGPATVHDFRINGRFVRFKRWLLGKILGSGTYEFQDMTASYTIHRIRIEDFMERVWTALDEARRFRKVTMCYMGHEEYVEITGNRMISEALRFQVQADTRYKMLHCIDVEVVPHIKGIVFV